MVYLSTKNFIIARTYISSASVESFDVGESWPIATLVEYFHSMQRKGMVYLSIASAAVIPSTIQQFVEEVSAVYYYM